MPYKKIVFLTLICGSSHLMHCWSFFGSSFTPRAPVVPEKRITIMLDPAGDSTYAGRTIEDHYERGITLLSAQEIKQVLEVRVPYVKVLLTRFAGETVEPEPLQNASFANKMQVDLYLSLNFYYNPDEQLKVWLYYMLYNTITDCWYKKQDTLGFYAYNMAHCLSLDQTKLMGAQILESLKKSEKQSHIICQGLFGIPFKPLTGITSPALACEISLPKKNSWKDIVNPLVTALESVISTLEAQQRKS